MFAIEKIGFHGDEIWAVRDEQGIGFAVVKRMCEMLGIDESNQRKKLKDVPWATTVIITAVAEDGKNRDVFGLRVDDVPMWLATIHASKVNESARPMLIRLQCEARDVLAAHFLRKAHPEEAGKLSASDVRAVMGPVVEALAVMRGEFGTSLLNLRSTLRTELLSELAAVRSSITPQVYQLGHFKRVKAQIAALRVRAKIDKSLAAAHRRILNGIQQHTGWMGPGATLANMPTPLFQRAEKYLWELRAEAERAVSLANADAQARLFS